MARREMRHQLRAAQRDRVAIVQHPIHMRAGTPGSGALLGRDVGVHHHQLRAGFLLDHARSFVVIAVRVADENDFRIAVFESELLDAFLDDRQILLEIGVDQNVAARRVDQVDGQICGAYVVQIAGNLKRRKLGVPIRIALRQHCARGRTQPKQCPSRHSYFASDSSA